MPNSTRIAVVGLGYVGLPLAVALANHFAVIGYDVNTMRIDELARGQDRTRELDQETLRASAIEYAKAADRMRGADIYIITVPTPITDDNAPDLTAVRDACRTVGSVIGKGAIVVLESTVYPGVTEEVCGPEIAAVSGLTPGLDFHLGYSPERINPGDRTHTVERIVKVVSGDTPTTTARLAEVYGAINGGNIFVAKSIRTAEAAKVIENAQRDINIAFINEAAMIFNRAGLSIYDVLAAASTKWNFLPFRPGLVGGHCIGIDPVYLAHFSQRLGHYPGVIVAGRGVNEAMSYHVASSVTEKLAQSDRREPAKILILGLSFKENVPDLRNSKVSDLIKALRSAGHIVDVHDSHADAAEANEMYDIELLPELGALANYDCVVGAVAHDEYCDLGQADFARLLKSGGIVADVKGIWRSVTMPSGIERWEL